MEPGAVALLFIIGFFALAFVLDFIFEPPRPNMSTQTKAGNRELQTQLTRSVTFDFTTKAGKRFRQTHEITDKGPFVIPIAAMLPLISCQAKAYAVKKGQMDAGDEIVQADEVKPEQNQLPASV